MRSEGIGTVNPQYRNGFGPNPRQSPALDVNGSASLGAERAVGRIPNQARVGLDAVQ